MAHISASIPRLYLVGGEFDWTLSDGVFLPWFEDVCGLIWRWFYQLLDMTMDSHWACARFTCLIQVRLRL